MDPSNHRIILKPRPELKNSLSYTRRVTQGWRVSALSEVERTGTAYLLNEPVDILRQIDQNNDGTYSIIESIHMISKENQLAELACQVAEVVLKGEFKPPSPNVRHVFPLYTWTLKEGIDNARTGAWLRIQRAPLYGRWNDEDIEVVKYMLKHGQLLPSIKPTDEGNQKATPKETKKATHKGTKKDKDGDDYMDSSDHDDDNDNDESEETEGVSSPTPTRAPATKRGGVRKSTRRAATRASSRRDGEAAATASSTTTTTRRSRRSSVTGVVPADEQLARIDRQRQEWANTVYTLTRQSVHEMSDILRGLNDPSTELARGLTQKSIKFMDDLNKVIAIFSTNKYKDVLVEEE